MHPDLLRAMPLLRPVPAAELEALRCERVERGGGERFFEQGTPADAAWGIVTGRVKIVKQSPKGREVILEVAAAGELFGAVAVLRDFPMPAAAVALEPTACVKVDGAQFRALLERHPQLVPRLMEMVTRRLIESHDARLDLATESVEVRLARALLHLAGKFGAKRGDEIVFSQSFTRQNLADLAGTTVETTIRTMSRWSREGLVRSESARITIARPDELRRMAL